MAGNHSVNTDFDKRVINGKFRDELLNRELFLSIDELRYVVNRWRMDYMAPAAFTKLCLDQDSATPRLAQDREIVVIYSHNNWTKNRSR